MPADEFRFKQFTIRQERCAMKVGTDGVVLGAWTGVEGARRILDIGTGTGLLALMSAQRNSEAHIDAMEIDQGTAEQAAMNASASPWSDRVHVHWMDARRIHASEPYDLVICNPPYYSGEMTSADVETSIAKHGVELDLEGLVRIVGSVLSPEGRFAVIVPADREHVLRLAGEALGMNLLRRGPLWYIDGRPFKRVLLELWRGAPKDDHDPVVVEHAPGRYTDAYRELLQPFMLKF